MSENLFFTAAFISYIITGAVFLVSLFRKERWARAAHLLMAAGLALHTAALAVRTVSSGHAPFTNMYESMSFLSWAMVIAYFVFGARGRKAFPKLGPILIMLVILVMALASSPLMPKGITPLVPALQSYWLWLHVSVTLIGEAFFSVAFVASILYLFTREEEKKRAYDALSYKAVAIGFPLFTLGGLIFGMIWAYRAWGSYWSWDPKEVWSLVTWFVFALYLHTRIVLRWSGRRSAFVAIIGFLCALFTYFGVNFLLKGLHSYA